MSKPLDIDLQEQLVCKHDQLSEIKKKILDPLYLDYLDYCHGTIKAEQFMEDFRDVYPHIQKLLRSIKC
jgi:hypothetical protein